jgi:hypothetical protein
VKSLEEHGVDISQTDLQNISLSGDMSAKTIAGFLSTGMEIIGPAIPLLIAISARIDVEEAGELDWGIALILAAQIIALNWEHIKNLLGQTQISKMLGLAGTGT